MDKRSNKFPKKETGMSAPSPEANEGIAVDFGGLDIVSLFDDKTKQIGK